MFDVLHRLPSASILAAALMLGGCAGTADFKPAFDGFAEAAKTDRNIMQVYAKIADADRLDKSLTSAAIGNKMIADPNKDACGMSATECYLVLTENGKESFRIDSQADDAKIRTLMTAIAEYAAGLQTIAGLDAEKNLDAAYTKTMANLAQSLSDAATLAKDKTEGNALKEYANDFSGLAQMALDGYFEQRKLEALQRGVGEINKIFPALMTICAASIHIGYSVELNALQDAYRKAAAAYNNHQPARSQAKPKGSANVAAKAANGPPTVDAKKKLLAQAYAAAKKYDTLLANDPQKAFDAAKASYEALNAALQNKDERRTAALVSEACKAARKAVDEAQNAQNAIAALAGEKPQPQTD